MNEDDMYVGTCIKLDKTMTNRSDQNWVRWQSRALYKKHFIAKMDECLFVVDSLWSYFHSSLSNERQTYQFVFKDFRSEGVFVDNGANVGA